MLAESSPLVPAGAVHGVFWGLVGACAVAQFFIVRAVVRPAPGAPTTSGPDAPQVPTPHRGIEIVWAVLPVVGLVALFLGAWPRLPH